MRTVERRTAGLTLLETIVAIAICGIVLATLSVVATSSLRQSRTGSFKVQATQMLDTIGRRIAGGFDETLLTSVGGVIDLDSDDVAGFAAAGTVPASGMEASIENLGAVTVGLTSLDRYEVEVCYESGGQRQCVSGQTLGKRGA